MFSQNFRRWICLFWKHCIFSVILEHWAKTSRFFAEKHAARFSKLHTRCLKKLLKDKGFFPENQVFFNFFLYSYSFLFIFFGLWAKMFGLPGKNIRWGYQNCILLVHMGILGKNVFLKFFCSIFGQWAKFFRPFVDFFFGGVIETGFYVSCRTFWHFEEKRFLLKKMCVSIRDGHWAKQIGICQKKLGRVVKTAFFVSIGKI